MLVTAKFAKGVIMTVFLYNSLLYIVPELLMPWYSGLPRISSTYFVCRPELFLLPRLGMFIEWAGQLIPLAITVVASALIIVKLLARANKKNNAVGPSAAEAKSLRRGLVITAGLTFVLFATYVPYSLSSLTNNQLSGLANRVLLMIVYANPSVDPFVHVLLVPKIRHALLKTFGCGGGGGDQAVAGSQMSAAGGTAATSAQ